MYRAVPIQLITCHVSSCTYVSFSLYNCLYLSILFLCVSYYSSLTTYSFILFKFLCFPKFIFIHLYFLFVSLQSLFLCLQSLFYSISPFCISIPFYCISPFYIFNLYSILFLHSLSLFLYPFSFSLVFFLLSSLIHLY